MTKIPYGKQDVNQDDIDAVVAVLRSDFLTQGPMVPLFESELARYVDADYAVAVNSATSALHLACLALGVGEGDSVWTSPITFVASANCALYCGAAVDFVDIDPVTYNMSVEKLSEKLEESRKSGKLPKVVIPVHFCGQPCDMQGIYALSLQYGFKIIEDASHAIGARYNSNSKLIAKNNSRDSSDFEKIGNCRFSDITVFSFHPVKVITSGEGGMVLTDDPSLAESIRELRSHGITTNISKMQPRPIAEIWNYQQIELGFNYRMTDLHAALGLSQLKRVEAFIEKRHSIARLYDQELGKLFFIQTPQQDISTYSSYHLYPICIKQNDYEINQLQVYKTLQKANVNVNLHYIPVYLQPYYQALGFKRGYCPQAEKYFQQTLSIPIFPTLTQADQSRIIETIQGLIL